MATDEYDIVLTLGARPSVAYFETAAAVIDSMGCAWMIHVYLERKEGAVDGLAREIEFRLFRQLMNGL
jgi:hypothetical protein